MIYDVSRQVLRMEVAFAAFCGLTALILPTPNNVSGRKNGQNVAQYAAAIREMLEIGSYIQFSLSMPMMETPQDPATDDLSLAHLARTQFVEYQMVRSPSQGSALSRVLDASSSRKEKEPIADNASRSSIDSARRKVRVHDFLGTWDVWSTIRTFCLYSPRLFVGKPDLSPSLDGFYQCFQLERLPLVEFFSLKIFDREKLQLTLQSKDLIIPRYLPPSSICFRWQSEPLRIVSIDTSTFFSNPSGYPVLTANHRALLTLYVRNRLQPCLLLRGTAPLDIEGIETANQVLNPSSGNAITGYPNGPEDLPTPSEAQANQARRRSGKPQEKRDRLSYLRYLRWFQGQQPGKSDIEVQSAGYHDYLQAPLQPLTDNLESVTYEVFEQDPVKYDQYERAIHQALVDWRDQGKTMSSQGSRIVVAVVGAGRGPLVTRALKASSDAQIPIELWALEKNQNAFVVLERQNALTWAGNVHLVHSDMRDWKGPCNTAQNKHYTIDIMISELLGSFGDNELSPECLDSVHHLLNPTHGISIPESYSAWLTPIASPKLHADFLERGSTASLSPNLPYVVLLQQFDYLSTKPHSSVKGPDIIASSFNAALGTPTDEYAAAREDDENGFFVTSPPQPIVRKAWSFSHKPSTALKPSHANKHNARHASFNFDLRHRAVCHGLAGYFEAILYPGIELSTNPQNKDQKSADMMSWFPIFFPLKAPIYSPDNSTLLVTMLRSTDGRKVWYEWMVEAWSNNPGTTGGTGFRLGCSDFMSSKEKGCLM